MAQIALLWFSLRPRPGARVGGGATISGNVDIAVVGAGPYGLSVAAHLVGRGADVRTFGEPMSLWRRGMPHDMMLKSDGFASSLSAGAPGDSLADYCRERAIDYHDTALPIPLQTFIEYALTFQQRYVPTLEQKAVVGLDRTEEGYRLELDDGEQVKARRVVMAAGVSHFGYLPDVLGSLSDSLVTHSSAHRDFSRFTGRDVTVLGAGASAINAAAALQDVGAEVRIITRSGGIKFSSPPSGRPPSLWRRLRHPSSGLGPGIRSRLCCDAPDLFHCLPATMRLEIVRRHLGPSSPWRMRERVSKASVLAGRTLAGATETGGKVRLELTGAEGSEHVLTDHVIAGTGFRADLDRLGFIAPALRARLRRIGRVPSLSSGFESSEPGLHFIGSTASASFGPLMRFMFGADFAARRVVSRLAQAVG